MTHVSNQTNSYDPEAVNSRVFVGNLNTFVVTKEDMERIFQRYGPVAAISMHKGYAFVQYTDTWYARSAVTGEDGRTVAGQVIDVNMVSEPKPHQVTRKRQQQVLNAFPTAFIGHPLVYPSLKRSRAQMLGVRLTTRGKGKLDKLVSLNDPVTYYGTKVLDDKGKRAHSETRKVNDSDILICGSCKELFANIPKWLEHKRQRCRTRFACRCHEVGNVSEDSSNSADSGRTTSPSCAQCQKKCATWWELIQHVQEDHAIAIYQRQEEVSLNQTGMARAEADQQMREQSDTMTESQTSSSVVDVSKDDSSCSSWDSGENGMVCEPLTDSASGGQDPEEEIQKLAVPEGDIAAISGPSKDVEDKAVDTTDLTTQSGEG